MRKLERQMTKKLIKETTEFLDVIWSTHILKMPATTDISKITSLFLSADDIDAEIDHYIKQTLEAIMNDEDELTLKTELTAYLLSGSNND